MRWLDRVMQERRYSLFWMPVVMTLVLGIILIICLFKVDAPYKWHTLGCVLITLLGWGYWLQRDQNRIVSTDNHDDFVHIHFFLYLGFAFIPAWFMACVVWNSYLTLNPLWMIDNGLVHQDTFFFAALAEGYNHSLSNTLLVNEEPHIRYHTLSIYVMHIIAKITGVQAFFAYNYLFPLLFFPLYAFLLLKAIARMKWFLLAEKCVSVIDVAMTVFIIEGMLPQSILLKLAVWKSSVFISQSFFLAVILSLLFFIISARGVSSGNESLRQKMAVAIIPIFIVLVSAAKISVGFCLTGMICYYFLRTNKRWSSAWWITVLYVMLFFGCFCMFQYRGGTLHNYGNQWHFEVIVQEICGI